MSRVEVREGELVVLCGPAGCGKSTWARERFPASAIVSSDACRERVCDDPAEQSVNAAAFALFHTTLALRLAAGRTAVADATSLEPASRRRLLALARENGAPALLLLLDLPEEICRERNASRARRVPDEALVRQFELLEELRGRIGDEGWDRILHLRDPDEADAARITTS